MPVDHKDFHIATSTAGGYRPLHERNVLERDGTVVVNVSSSSNAGPPVADVAAYCMLLGGHVRLGAADRWEPLGRWLINSHRVIVFVDWQGMATWTPENIVELLKAGARIIVSKPVTPPVQLKSYSITQAPFAPGLSEATNL